MATRYFTSGRTVGNEPDLELMIPPTKPAEYLSDSVPGKSKNIVGCVCKGGHMGHSIT